MYIHSILRSLNTPVAVDLWRNPAPHREAELSVNISLNRQKPVTDSVYEELQSSLRPAVRTTYCQHKNNKQPDYSYASGA